MYKSMFSALPSDLSSSILYKSLQSSISHTAILAQVNQAFYHTVQRFWETKSFLIPICLQYAQEHKDRHVDLDKAFFAQCSKDFLKVWIQLHHIEKYAITVENILNRFDEAEQMLALLENASSSYSSSALFELHRLKASMFIHPQGSYHLDLKLFDIGFYQGRKCFKDNIQYSPAIYFIMGAYWRNLLEKYSNDLKNFYQDFGTRPLNPFLECQDFETHLQECRHISERCKKAKKECISFISLGLQHLSESINEILQLHEAHLLALAHPDAPRLIACIQDSLQANVILPDLTTVCPHRLYTLCMRPYLPLLEAKTFTFSQLIHLDNDAFDHLDQPVSDGLSSPVPLVDKSSSPKRPFLDEDSLDISPLKKQKYS